MTPLPFDLSSGKTYADKGSKTVWCRSVGGSGLDKRQATVQLTIFGDGMPRAKPLVIFRGTGQRITQAQKQDYDHRVTVKFHPNAWCDETMFLFWARHVETGVVTPKMLVLDSHQAQITNNALMVMKQECNTTVITIDGGLTPVLQPLDVLFNKPFKTRVDYLFNEHLTANLDAYLNGTIPAKRHRVLMTKWVGQTWHKVSVSLQEQIKAVFKSIGIGGGGGGREEGELPMCSNNCV